MKCQTCGAEIGFFKMMGHKKMHKDEPAKPAGKSAGAGGKSGSAGKTTSRPPRK